MNLSLIQYPLYLILKKLLWTNLYSCQLTSKGVYFSVWIYLFGSVYNQMDYKLGYTHDSDFALELIELAALLYVPADNVILTF